MSIQSEDYYGDIRSLIRDVGKEAIQSKGDAASRTVTLAAKDYNIEAIFNPNTREIDYKVTSLDSRKAEKTNEKKSLEFTEKLGFFGGRNIGTVEHKMASKLRNYSSMTDCLKHRVKHASIEKTTSAYVNGQKYRIKTSAKESDGTVSVTLMALDKSGNSISTQTFRCSNNKIDEEGKNALKKVSVRSSDGGKKTITRFEQKAYIANLKSDMERTRNDLNGYAEKFEKILGDLGKPSANIKDVAEALGKLAEEFLDAHPASEPRNMGVRTSATHMKELVIAMGNRKITTADAAAADLKKNINEFKVETQGRCITDLMSFMNDPKVLEGEKPEAREKLAEIANQMLESKDFNFVRDMTGLSNNLMRSALEHGIFALAKGDGNKKLEEDSRTMLNCFKDEKASVEDRTLAMTKLSILYKTGFYKGSPLGKDIEKAAQEFVADMSFLGIAAINEQGEDFAKELKAELLRRGLPTDGKLFVQQLSSAPQFDTGATGCAVKVHNFEIKGLKVIVGELKPGQNPPDPHIGIFDSNYQPLHTDYRRIKILRNKEITPEDKLKQLEELESALNRMPPDLTKLAESCTDIVVSPGKIHPGVQNFTRPVATAKDSVKERQRIKEHLSKLTPGGA